MTRASFSTQLAHAVAGAFLSAGFSAQDLLTGQIVHTDLPWQCPPLVCADLLGGLPFDSYLNYPVNIDEAALYSYWRGSLIMLYASPASMIRNGQWKGTNCCMRSSSSGERALRFSVPDNFPKYNPMSGHVFSLEMANLFATSGTNRELYSDWNNYWVKTTYGDVGVRDGKVIDSEEWSESLEGVVETLLLSGRGQVSTSCRYDLLAKVRSVLHENVNLFAEEFEGINWALQTLAKLSQDRLCSELMAAIENMVPNGFETKRRIRIIDEALDILDAWTVNDRIKIATLFETLVPAVYSAGAFYNQIFNMSKKVPVAMQEDTHKKIRDRLMKRRTTYVSKLSPRERAEFERAM